MAITATALNAEYGAHYINKGQNAQRLRKKVFYGTETDGFFSPVNTDNTLWEMANGTQTRVVQPFQKDWSPTGDVTFTPAPIRLRRMKIDVEFYPDELVDNWMGFLTTNNLDRKTWPFVRWYLEEFLTPQAAEDFELNEIYAGVFLAPPTAGTAGAAGTAIDGIKKLINDNYADDTIPTANQITTGAFNADAQLFVEQIEDFVAATNARYRNRVPMKLLIGNEYEMRWKQGVREKYNMNYEQISANERMRIIDAPNVELYFSPAVGSEEKIVMTTMDNAIMPIKDMANVGNFRITDNTDRQVKVFTDYHKGIGFVDYNKVFTNDRNLTAS